MYKRIINLTIACLMFSGSAFADTLSWHTSIFGGLEDATQLLNCLPFEFSLAAKIVPYPYVDPMGNPANYTAVVYPDVDVDCSQLSEECKVRCTDEQ